MKKSIVVSLLLGLLAVSVSVSAEELKPIGKAKVCGGAGGSTMGMKMTMVMLAPAEKHRVLLKFEDFDGSSWNDKVVMHTIKGTDPDQDQLYQSTEMERPTVYIHPGGDMEVQPLGSNTNVHMACAPVDNDEVNPFELINAYTKAKKK